ncbi:hypothetical protein [Aestuariivirga sp.]|uniref:hypothetical protein n=1 Tax=Aestuariivirga sp. TaxID=2650926 RepID=UPI0039E5C849
MRHILDSSPFGLKENKCAMPDISSSAPHHTAPTSSVDIFITNVGSSELVDSPSESKGADVPSFLERMSPALSFKEALDEACQWNGGAGLFMGWRDKLAGPLTLSYRLFLALLNSGDEAMACALKHSYFAEHRKRLPKIPNKALVAVQLVAKPFERRDMAACSDYAKFLWEAFNNEIEPHEFAEKMSGVPLKPRQAAGKPSLRVSDQQMLEVPEHSKAAANFKEEFTAALCGDTSVLSHHAATRALVEIAASAKGVWTVKVIAKLND